MTEEDSKEQLDKDMEQFFKDLDELEKKIGMIGKRYKSWKDMTSDDINALLIKEPFVFH